MTVTTALYRRYRPDSFADVIGQEHVTEPLMTALRKNRVNHAYLFSGPRGCGKTTSARILARCLNCAQGPTDTPCGTCQSCVELARGGSGSLDVIEIDAASHGGVDDARDLRERATYAPVRDRYKIFIIDEAHMVTSAGFNALLKIVEEPPEHIKFIFATTEPDKVIGTIRSRTHHYPFRLVPPEPLMAYLELLCKQENVPVAPGVLSLVIRAGGGSVRDSLSVLDQLMAGAGPNGLDYELAVALLGYTHASLLDDVVEAVAASDAATVFRAVDRVIQTGHDPRRFVEDLLERFRDLIIVQAMPESAQTILRGMPADQIARLKNQAHNLGAAELSRAADVTNTALTEMTGATSPRLHLELLCARILLPSSEQNERGMAARIDRVERRLNYAGNDVGAPAAVAGAQPLAPASDAADAAGAATSSAPAAAPAPAPRHSRPEPAVAEPVRNAPAVSAPAGPEPGGNEADGQAASSAQEPAGSAPAGRGSRAPLTAPRVTTGDWPVEAPAGARPDHAGARQNPTGPQPAESAPAAAPAAPAAPSVPTAPAASPAPEPSPEVPARAAGTPAAGGPGTSPAAMGDVEVLRRAWPDVLQTLAKIKRSTWALVEPNAQVSAFDGHTLTLSFTTSGLAGAFGRADHSENLRQAIHKTVGIDCQITAVAGGAGRTSSDPNPKAPASRPAPAGPGTPPAPSTAAPATSADVAWGLAPAASGQEAGAAAPAPSSARTAGAGGTPHANGQPPAAQDVQPGSAPDTARPSAQQKDRPSAAPSAHTAGSPAAAPGVEAPSAIVPPALADPYSGGDYSYSDDDWGPPRDEDAPPLDEEPPLDWDPAARTQPRSAGAGTNGQDLAKRPASGHTDAPSQPRPQADRDFTASGAGTGSRNGSTATGPATAGGAPHDPWTRAVEQAPGVWVVGEASNVGKAVPAALPENEPAPSGTTPRYEPATAQVPPSIPVNTAAASVDAEWGLATTPSDPGPSGPAPAPAREYAMASAAPLAGAAARPAAPAPAVPAPAVPNTGGAPAVQVSSPASTAVSAAPVASQPATGTRQSLYQRLSNSPEAEAGRAKAPARAIPAAATYVQDIPSPDDETIEASGVFGRAAVERILGGKLVEERSLDGSPVTPRY